MKHIILLAAIALLNVVIWGQPDTSLTAENWYVVSINGEIVNNPKMFLKFNKAAKTINGNGGCNQLYGNYKIKGKSLKISQFSMTKMFCPEENVMIWESNFVNALKQTTRFVINGNDLLLSDGNKSLVNLTNQKPVAEDPNLSGKKWILKKIGYSAVPKTEEVAFIIFDKEKGTISGNTSCNLFNGKYRVNGKKIMLWDIISTKRACTEDNVEMKFLDGLHKTEWFSILMERLNLSLGRFDLMSFEEQK
jgi:heat shock protein HslJ